MLLTFPSHGRQNPIDVFFPRGEGRQPTIVVLHGSAGHCDLPDYSWQLASHGYVTLVPHYFQVSGTCWADPDAIQRHGFSWGKTIMDAIGFATQLPNVDPARIGLMGYSLGGYLAIAVGSHDPRVKCVVEFFGGVPGKFGPSIENLPPTLILHGEDDEVVPVRHALQLKRLCEEKKVCFEVEFYPGAGHRFSESLMQRASERALRFLDQRLKGLHPE